MPLFRHILLPIDFSDHCERSAEYAAWFARVTNAVTHFVHVVGNPADPLYEPQEVPYWILVEHGSVKARSLLEATAQRCFPEEARREYHVMNGDPFEKLMEAIERIEPDLVILSSHGRGLKHLVIGSVVERVVRHAPCPVFVVRGKDESQT
jgi:nucleotide-binding universal stress UspA family protein